MTGRWLLALLALLWTGGAGIASAQGDDYEKVELRVSAERGGGIVAIDRGSADGLKIGDLVFFYPREGGTKGGNVLELQERSALVDLHDPSRSLPPGTKGQILVPLERFAQAEPEESPLADEENDENPNAEGPTDEGKEADGNEQRAPGYRWTNRDEDFQAGDPLLARMRPVRPEDRSTQFTGRVYVSGDGRLTTLDDRSDAFLRAGADLSYENPFGHGGFLNIDGEVNSRVTNLPDEGDEAFSKLRFDRFSYGQGGTRFRPFGWEAGRFLQRGLPEFGILDGAEWGWRRRNGDRYGVSLGFLPEPDADLSTGQDLQLAAYYHWEIDADRNFAADLGYQKTWHNGNADRDLLVAKVRYAPLDAWNLYATTWIDYYGSTDRLNGTSLDLTQALVVLDRRGADGGVSWTFTHQSFPETDRQPLQIVEDDQIQDDHDDRLAFSAWRRAGGHRLHGQLGGWVDEEDEGLDANLGIDFQDLLFDRSRTDVTGFASQGQFSNTWGLQTSWQRSLDDGFWSLFYEFSFNNNVGFNDDVDDILQHRLRASRNVYDFAGWNVEMHAEVRTFDDEGSVTVGFYLQRGY